jgi:hypothetical protein
MDNTIHQMCRVTVFVLHARVMILMTQGKIIVNTHLQDINMHYMNPWVWILTVTFNMPPVNKTIQDIFESIFMGKQRSSFKISEHK